MIDMGIGNDDSPLINLRRPIRKDIVSRGPEYDRYPTHLSVAEIRLARTRLDCDSFAPQVRGLIVGENPGPNTHPDLPLFPWPDTSSAGRLLSMSRLTPGEYLGGLYRRNVCRSAWSRFEAKATARELVTVLFDMPRDLAVIICGVKAATAFGFEGYDYWDPIRLESRQTAVIIPHPSGLNRMYNDPTNRELTGAWLRWAATGDHER